MRLPATTSQDELLATVEELNADDAIDGMLVQLPLPEHIDEAPRIRAIDPVKDVDGLHPLNAGLLYLGRPGHRARDAARDHAAARRVRRAAQGARAVVVGRSAIVGKPVALLLLAGERDRDRVPLAHAPTSARETREADVLVVAVGRRERDRRRRW